MPISTNSTAVDTPPDDLAARYPMTVAGASTDPDTMFRTSIQLLCAGIAAQLVPVS
ncbi:hypothetical protein [Cryptosporangium japonicum]|uniref:hypothetical protein n=1 Tax=Cryptosporangium japonicum TaxID=80872 RepID=UPI0031CEBF56